MREHLKDGTAVVDGLRGLAILMVFGYHTWLFSWFTPPAPFDIFARTGYFGVELFFLISGFCLFYPYARHMIEGTSKQDARTFAFRRFIKIVPSYLIALAVTFAVAFPLLQRPGVWNEAVAEHLLFVENFFNDALGSTNAVFWSLGIEVQFYLVFPVLAALFMLRPLLAALGMILIAIAYRYALAGCCLQTEVIVRQLPAFLDLFAFGMLAAYAFVWIRTRCERSERVRVDRVALAGTLAALAGLALVCALLASADAVQYTDHGRESFSLAGRTLLGGSAFLLVLGSCFAHRWWRAVVANPLLIFLSLVSYNLYLWHTLVELWLVHHHLPWSPLGVAHNDAAWRPWFIGVSIVACVGISAAVTYFVERPLLQTVRPHSFAFDWPGFFRRLKRAPPA